MDLPAFRLHLQRRGAVAQRADREPQEVERADDLDRLVGLRRGREQR